MKKSYKHLLFDCAYIIKADCESCMKFTANYCEAFQKSL